MKETTPAAAKAAPQPAPEPVPHISPSDTTLMEFEQNWHRSIAPRGRRPEDFHLDAGPFELISEKFTRFDHLQLADPDGLWVAGLICVDCGPGYAMFKLIWQTDVPPRRSLDDPLVPAGFKIEQTNCNELGAWRIRRLSDDVILNAGVALFSKPDALAYLNNHATVRQRTKPLAQARVDRSS